MLRYRLYELLSHDGISRGPSGKRDILLADSPGFHIPVRPHYVLRRGTEIPHERRAAIS